MAQNKSNGLPIILGVLCLVFLASTVWLYMSRPKTNKTTGALASTTEKLRNADEVKLQDAIDDARGDTLTLSDTAFKQPIIISDTLHIDQDTLYIKAKGNIVLQKDTAYHGPGLSLSPKSKMIVLENIKFKDFDVAISMYNTGFFIKNTQFINCKLPVQRNYMLPDKNNITADFTATNIHSDSVAKPKTTVKPNGAR